MNYFYLEGMLNRAREYLPSWLYREFVRFARAYAGGKSRGVGKVYNSLDELPESVKKLPEKRQRQWMHVFNSAWARYDPKKHRAANAEEFAFAQAWAAVNASMEKSDERTFVIFSKDEPMRVVYGVVYEPDTVDAQGDFARADAIEKAAHQFMIDYRGGVAGIFYRHQQPVNAYVVESFIAPEDLEIWDVRKGSWVLAVRVNDDEIWKAVEEGEITGFSMGGFVVGA